MQRSLCVTSQVATAFLVFKRIFKFSFFSCREVFSVCVWRGAEVATGSVGSPDLQRHCLSSPFSGWQVENQVSLTDLCNGMNIHGGSKSFHKRTFIIVGVTHFLPARIVFFKTNNVPRRFGLLLCLSLLGRGRDCVGLWADYCSLGLGALTLTKWRCVLCPHFHSCPKNITIVQKFHSRGLKYIWHAKLRSATSLSCNFS